MKITYKIIILAITWLAFASNLSAANGNASILSIDERAAKDYLFELLSTSSSLLDLPEISNGSCITFGSIYKYRFLVGDNTTNTISDSYQLMVPVMVSGTYCGCLFVDSYEGEKQFSFKVSDLGQHLMRDCIPSGSLIVQKYFGSPDEAYIFRPSAKNPIELNSSTLHVFQSDKLAHKNSTKTKSRTISVGQDTILYIPMVLKVQYNLCWAGAITSDLQWYGFDVELCNVANTARVMGLITDNRVACCSNLGSCNYGLNTDYTEKLLEAYGFEVTRKTQPLPTDTVRAYLSKGDPIVVSIKWKNEDYGNHLVLMGIQKDAIWYMNPWDASYNTCTYDYFVNNNRYYWQYSNIPTRSARLNAPVLVCPVADTTYRTDLVFVWQSDPKASKYHVVIENSLYQRFLDTTVSDNSLMLKIPNLDKYIWRVRSILNSQLYYIADLFSPWSNYQSFYLNDTILLKGTIQSSEIRAYPNPGASRVTLETTVDFYSFVVFNSLGEVVYEATSEKSQRAAYLSVDALATGIYFVKARNANGDQVAFRKFVKYDN